MEGNKWYHTVMKELVRKFLSFYSTELSELYFIQSKPVKKIKAEALLREESDRIRCWFVVNLLKFKLWRFRQFQKLVVWAFDL